MLVLNSLLLPAVICRSLQVQFLHYLLKELRFLAAEHRNTVFEMEDRVARFPEQEQRLTAILNDLHT